MFRERSVEKIAKMIYEAIKDDPFFRIRRNDFESCPDSIKDIFIESADKALEILEDEGVLPVMP